MSKVIETKMSGDASLRHAQADFASTFAAFKAANDERLAQIEAKSAADPLLAEKVSRIDAALQSQQDRVTRLTINAATPGAQPETQNRSEVKSAWSGYIRTGDTNALAALEGKSLTVGTDAEGGYVAPAQTESRIDRALTESSPFRQICTVRQVGANSYKKPVSADGTNAGWAGETDARPMTDSPVLELLDIPTGELYAMPAATQMLLDDGVADVDQWLADEVRDVFAAQETAAFVGGNGVNKPKGILGYSAVANSAAGFGTIGYVPTGTDGGFDAGAPIDALIELIYAPKSRYRAGASFVMNRRTVSALRKFKDADGNYIWQPAQSAGQPSTLLGYPLVEAEDMPDIASDTTPIAFGDFRRGYLIVDRQGVRVLRDPYSAKPYVLFYTTKRVGGGVQDFDALKLLKFSLS
ncbi:phage major capsid protein [Robiginitomaculum antarcticum]|uniref:phage major capsid protein n=1 Tax=Robiginitomaculum antarcticum TaxID=437507 RepID=UPI000370FAE1|nr:phage major capsid protein [Robiginitomaculum antarcticum]